MVSMGVAIQAWLYEFHQMSLPHVWRCSIRPGTCGEPERGCVCRVCLGEYARMATGSVFFSDNLSLLFFDPAKLR